MTEVRERGNQPLDYNIRLHPLGEGNDMLPPLPNQGPLPPPITVNIIDPKALVWLEFEQGAKELFDRMEYSEFYEYKPTPEEIEQLINGLDFKIDLDIVKEFLPKIKEAEKPKAYIEEVKESKVPLKPNPINFDDLLKLDPK